MVKDIITFSISQGCCLLVTSLILSLNLSKALFFGLLYLQAMNSKPKNTKPSPKLVILVFLGCSLSLSLSFTISSITSKALLAFLFDLVITTSRVEYWWANLG